nr:hypothetical protein [uncultured Flavobacterium sp.]
MNELPNLQYSPILRQLLAEYCKSMYEENAILDDYHLFEEYKLLFENNVLNVLFEEEYFRNLLKHGNNRG